LRAKTGREHLQQIRTRPQIGRRILVSSSLSDLADQRNNGIRIAPATYKDCAA
jgi:hypothetical protein